MRHLGISQRLLLFLNRGHFGYRSGPGELSEYARWQYAEGQKLWKRFFSSRIDLKRKEVLDIGCGPGGKTCLYVKLGARRVTGVDLSEESIKQAESAKRVLLEEDEGRLVAFVLADAGDLPFKDGSFDVVMCSDSFEHFADPVRVLSEAARVLREDGLMGIDFAQWGAYNGHHLGDFFRVPWVHLIWPQQDIVQVVRELGEAEKRRNGDPGVRDEIDDLVRRRLEQFENNLNHLTLDGFERMLRREKRLRRVWCRRTAANPVLWPLTVVPLAREVVVARNVYVLKRAGGQAQDGPGKK